MDSITLSTLLPLAGCLFLGAVIGYFMGSRRSRRNRRDMQQTLSAQGLELLDTRSDCNRLRKQLAQTERKDRLLALALQRLKTAESGVRRLSSTVKSQERRHYIATSRLRLAAAKSREQALRATRIAQRATTHLKRLDAASPATQTISAPVPKSYGQGESVTVSVVDQLSPDTQQDAVTRMSNLDSSRLARLHSSNEGRREHAPATSSIRHITPDVERRLRQVGVTQIEDLETMSDVEFAALRRAVNELSENDSNGRLTHKPGQDQRQRRPV